MSEKTCIQPDMSYALNVTSKYQSDHGDDQSDHDYDQGIVLEISLCTLESIMHMLLVCHINKEHSARFTKLMSALSRIRKLNQSTKCL